MKRVHLLITGQVTKVGFRFAAVWYARNLGLTGWVRNLPASRQVQGGVVEIVAEGEKEKLENLVTWAREGPPLARVGEVEVKWEKATEEFQEFSVKK